MSDLLEKRVQQLERILEVSRELTSTVALEPLLKKIVATAAELTGSESASILLWDARTGKLRFRAACGGLADQLADIPVPVEDSIAGAVLQSREPLIVSDAQSDPRHYDEVGQRIGRRSRSLVAAPMEIKERCIGVLEAVNKRGDQEFVQEDVETLMALGAQAAVAIENARLVEALREAYARLGELDRLKSDFISIASHELRTPLALILGYATLLQKQLRGGGESQLDVVLRAALRLKNLIEAMLNLRYLETGEVELSCDSLDLREEVRKACDVYATLAAAEDLTLNVRVPDESLQVWGDRDKIHVVLDNLLSNAVKFTPPGGQVWVTAAKRGNRVEVAVIDNGVSIPQEDIERVFEPFEQVEDHLTRQHGGMGLGLSIVRGLVELHGGRVWAESLPDHGSRFVFVLPMEQLPSSEET